MVKRRVGVVGQGFVGGSLTQVLTEKGLDVLTYDKAGKCQKELMKRNSIASLVEDLGVDGPPIVFVCVPTPMNADGSCDTSIVEGVLSDLRGMALVDSIAVVKSTVPPGSTERWNAMFGPRLHVVFNPEFLREQTALDDMRNQDRIILGGPRPWVDDVRNLYHLAFPDVPVHKTSSSNAEFVKYITNCFLATKVSFANEMFQVCQGLKDAGFDVDYDRTVELATLDGRLGASHWRVPGPMPADDGTGRLLPGFAGSCFIKDLNALMYLSRQLGIDPKVLSGAWEKNLEVRPERDWENLKGRAVVAPQTNKTKG